MKGLPIEVYRNSNEYDCTNGGASAKSNRFILVDKAIDGPFEVEENDIYLVVVRRQLFGEEYLHLEPRINNKALTSAGHIGAMFGGNFAYTSDSRFSALSKRPLPIHDRSESQAMYNSMSI